MSIISIKHYQNNFILLIWSKTLSVHCFYYPSKYYIAYVVGLIYTIQLYNSFSIKSYSIIEFLAYSKISCLLMLLFLYNHINHNNTEKSNPVYSLCCCCFTIVRRYVIIYDSNLQLFRSNWIQILNSSLIIIFYLIVVLVYYYHIDQKILNSQIIF